MNTESMYTALGITPAVHRFGEEVLAGLRARFDEIDRVAEYNQCKVIGAMQKNRVDATHFAATTGYGYNDAGRDNLERVYADCFHTEAALVRPQITCGTHALTVALSANLLPGDTLLSPVGAPYDTLEEVIGIRPSACSLKEYGVHYRQVDLLPDYGFDYPAIEQALRGGVKLVTIQRSKGYATRPTFSVAQIGELIAFCKRVDPNAAHRQEGDVTRHGPCIGGIVGIAGHIDPPALQRDHIAHPVVPAGVEGLAEVIGGHGGEGQVLHGVRLSGPHRQQLRRGKAGLQCRRHTRLRQHQHRAGLHHPTDILRGEVVIVVVGDEYHVRIAGRVRHAEGVEPHRRPAGIADAAVAVDGKTAQNVIHGAPPFSVSLSV